MPQIDAGLGWLLAVNLVLWTGLFLYILRLHRMVHAAERELGARIEPNGERR